MALKLKIKKTLLKRKVEGVTKEGYYGRVITNGTKSFEDIVKTSTHGSTLDYREAELLAARFKGQNEKNKLEKYEKTIIYFGCNYYVDSLR